MNNYPKLHNAGWPGVVGKGPDAEEPFLDLDTILDLTTRAEVEALALTGLICFSALPTSALNLPMTI